MGGSLTPPQQTLDTAIADAWKETEFIDITERFLLLGENLPSDTLLKCPNFDLFEGTRSLEVDNAKLDSSLIPLSQCEAEFDCDKAYGQEVGESKQIEYVTAIVDRLLRLVLSWLNNYQTLPTTILSCRYLEHILVYSGKNGSIFKLKSSSPIYDNVLTGCVAGVAAFARFVQKLLEAGVVFEEEDLNFNNMGLDFDIFAQNRFDITAMLDRGLEFLQSYNEHSMRLVYLIKLLKDLIQIQDILDSEIKESTVLDSVLETVQELETMGECQYEVPLGSFSMGIQKRFTNQFPPSQLAEVVESFQGFAIMAKDLQSMCRVADAQTSVEMLQFAYYYNRNPQRHVIARAMFSLFFIRDDMSILGRIRADKFLENHILEFSLASTSTTRDKLTPEALLLFEPALDQGLKALFELYQNSSQNICRYRQGLSRSIVLWDSFQAQMESAEAAVEPLGLLDMCTRESNIPLMPYTTWAYAMKLEIMIEFVLRGYQLEIYQPYEVFAMYWYSYYLSHQYQICLEKVYNYIIDRKSYISGMQKKMKKTKAGEKKENLRAAYQHLSKRELPQLNENQKFVNYKILTCTITKSMCLAEVLQFSILKSFRILDDKPDAEKILVSERMLHSLRFKPFSSIGVPELPAYEVFKASLDEFLIAEPMLSVKLRKAVELINKELDNATANIDKIIKVVEGNGNSEDLLVGSRLVKEEVLGHYGELLRSVQAIRVNSNVVTSKVGSSLSGDDLRKKYTVELQHTENCSPLFPVLSLSGKVPRHPT